jgi:hypothetical protein
MVQSGDVDLVNLLTAAGVAAGAANNRLAAGCAPALLREFTVELRFDAGFTVADDAATLLLTRPRRPNAQMQAMMRSFQAGVTVNATYIAAPSLQPVPPT